MNEWWVFLLVIAQSCMRWMSFKLPQKRSVLYSKKYRTGIQLIKLSKPSAWRSFVALKLKLWKEGAHSLFQWTLPGPSTVPFDSLLAVGRDWLRFPIFLQHDKLIDSLATECTIRHSNNQSSSLIPWHQQWIAIWNLRSSPWLSTHQTTTTCQVANYWY